MLWSTGLLLDEPPVLMGEGRVALVTAPSREQRHQRYWKSAGCHPIIHKGTSQAADNPQRTMWSFCGSLRLLKDLSIRSVLGYVATETDHEAHRNYHRSRATDGSTVLTAMYAEESGAIHR